MIDLGIFAPLDEAIRRAAPEEHSGLMAALAARMAAVAARSLAATPSGIANQEPASRNLSAKEAAKRLGVSLPYLYKHADDFPFTVHIGNRVVFDSAGIEAWNRGQRAP